MARRSTPRAVGRPRDLDARPWYEVDFVRFRLGFVDHLRNFGPKPDALLVYNWALLVRDFETGEFVADRRAIMRDCGLSDWRAKSALAWLRHGRGCGCSTCSDDSKRPDRPSYFAEVRRAFRSTPPIYKIRRDDSEFLAALRRARSGDHSQAEILFPQFGDNSRG